MNKHTFCFLILFSLLFSNCKKSTDTASPSTENKNWQLLSSINFANGNQGISDMCFSDPTHLWGVGAYNFLIKSTDAGSTWSNFTVDAALPFYCTWSSVCFPTPEIGYIGGGGCIYKTINAGQSWFLTYDAKINGTIYSPQDICFLDTLKGFACGLSGTLKKTLDGGKTWIDQNISNTAINFSSIKFKDKDHGWAVGNLALLATTDGGNSWTLLHSALDLNENPYSFGKTMTARVISDLSSTDLFSYNTGEGLIKSTDGGSLWQTCGPVIRTGCEVNSVFMKSNAEGFCAIGANGGGNISHTTDGGKSWSTFAIPDPNSSSVQDFITYENLLYVYTVGYGGGKFEVLKYLK